MTSRPLGERPKGLTVEVVEAEGPGLCVGDHCELVYPGGVYEAATATLSYTSEAKNRPWGHLEGWKPPVTQSAGALVWLTEIADRFEWSVLDWRDPICHCRAERWR